MDLENLIGMEMKQIDRTKVCLKCEADVSCEATYCPFCGTDLLPSSESPNGPAQEDGNFSDHALQESLASLYKPPYSVRNRQGLGVPDEREETTFKEASPQTEDPLFQSYEQVEPVQQDVLQEPQEEVKRGTVLPLLLLMIGTHLLILGVLLFFCSKEGKVTLEWSSHFWFLYCLASFPLLYFGSRFLKKS